MAIMLARNPKEDDSSSILKEVFMTQELTNAEISEVN